MATGYYLSDGATDLDAVFEPGTGTAVSQYPRKDNGKALQYAPLSLGSAVATTGYENASGADFNTLWAKKGSVAYLQNPPTFPNAHYSTAPVANSSVYSPPSGLIMPSVSSVFGTNHLSIFVRLVFYSDGTWWAWVAATNRYDDSWWHSNSILGTDLTQYNPSSGNFTTSFQTGGQGSGYVLTPTPAIQLHGNWLQNTGAGYGAGYTITASFSDVYDYTSTASTLTGGSFTFTQGLKGATSGMNIACNGGFAIVGGSDPTNSGGTIHSSLTNQSLASSVTLCYGFNASGGFGGNIKAFQGPDGVLRWILYSIATIKLSNVAGTSSVTGKIGLGAAIYWADYSDSGDYVPPEDYTSSNLDAVPWTTANTGAGSQGQWTYGSGGGGGGGGGTGGCVVLDAGMFDGRVAREFDYDDRILITDPYAAEGEANSSYGTICHSKPTLQPCVEVETAQGALLKMSTTAPIPTMDHEFVVAPNLLGERIPIGKREDVMAGDGTTHVPFLWDEVIAVRDIGMQWVQHLSVDHIHHCFWASSGGDWFILHHNLKSIEGAQ